MAERESLAGAGLSSLLKSLQVVMDPRKARGTRYPLLSVLATAILGCVCGCDDAESLEDWGDSNKQWLQSFLDMPHGTPTQDVFLRVLAAIDPQEFRMAFLNWAQSLFEVMGVSGQIAIDGQTFRASSERAAAKGPVHMVHALACEQGLVIGQLATEAKSNEIKAIPQLLQLLDLRGALVSVDAMGCQKAIAKTIRDRGGDYLFGLKGNQSALKGETEALFHALWTERKHGRDEVIPPAATTLLDVDKGHGRLEEREVTVCHDFREWVPASAQWADLSTLVAIRSRRMDVLSDKETTATRYYISSRHLTPKQAVQAVRNHWHVENQLHWCLDVTFGQDHCTVRKQNAAQNFAVVRHFALDLIRAYKGDRYSVPRRRRLCLLRQEYREALLAGVTST